ncbi:hypothetical protein ABT115_19810 [Streptomyces sp. NPDC001832]
MAIIEVNGVHKTYAGRPAGWEAVTPCHLAKSRDKLGLNSDIRGVLSP